ncbi:unnamed protein product [Arabidopsis lyrata]|nr:unnamed protein product [Arabidopsis lyrata]
MCANCSGFLPLSSSVPASISYLISSNFMIFSGKIFGVNEEDDALILLLSSSLDLLRIIGSFCVLGDGHGGGEEGLGLQSHLQPNKKPIHMP